MEDISENLSKKFFINARKPKTIISRFFVCTFAI